MSDPPQPIKESIAMGMVDRAIDEKWIKPTSYTSYLNAVAKAIQALEGNPQNKESMNIELD